ncbi:hypothetical protein A2627_05125 [Candidatus Woesebacteria bacterium RIFCSPHIGHO2_01_FULL_39_28]|uniref:Uncharacterized protein n=1 Tax=Candidatus Woesebacteria bacterium RIFCSPHIGHO2_01_FULL_39_28 TaxID=1802496 RepID=A0A1F7YDQ9_9BACT|nr:MAG: hypothetical protein A2627_05125 [Candidatus Woesebacteria bacterium RIFCSPHIGHO2_01_FULL_39_28]
MLSGTLVTGIREGIIFGEFTTGNLNQLADQIRERAKRGALEHRDVVDYFRGKNKVAADQRRAITGAIKNGQQVRDEVGLTEIDTKNYRAAAAARKFQIDQNRTALTALNALRIPGPTFVREEDRFEIVDRLAKELDPDDHGWPAYEGRSDLARSQAVNPLRGELARMFRVPRIGPSKK